MLSNYLKTSLFLIAILFFVSCEKDITCIEPVSGCELNCQMIPDMGWCGTGATFKYYFDPVDGECKSYIHVGDDVPFETLQECESCRCNGYNTGDNDN
jgi:hypothetical protein